MDWLRRLFPGSNPDGETDTDDRDLTPQETRALKEIAQARIAEWPTRRKVVASAAGGALATAGVIGAAGSASAADTSVGAAGANGSPVDVFADEVRDEGGDVFYDLDDTGAVPINRNLDLQSSQEIQNAAAVTTGGITIDDAWHYAGSDSELDTVLSNVSEGDTILLGNTTFSNNRTISTRGLVFRGTVSPGSVRGTDISGTWTLSEQLTIKHCQISTAPDFNSRDIGLVSCGMSAALSTDQDLTRVFHCDGNGFDFTFENGTSGGIIDGNLDFGTITDNGSNTVGDNG
jgi:hypothetical protein